MTYNTLLDFAQPNTNLYFTAPAFSASAHHRVVCWLSPPALLLLYIHHCRATRLSNVIVNFADDTVVIDLQEYQGESLWGGAKTTTWSSALLKKMASSDGWRRSTSPQCYYDPSQPQLYSHQSDQLCICCNCRARTETLRGFCPQAIRTLVTLSQIKILGSFWFLNSHSITHLILRR